MTAVAMTLNRRHWSLGIGAALLLHGGFLVAFHTMMDGGTVAPGIGGIEVGLPPAGAAPGTPAESTAPEAAAVAPAETAAVPPAPVPEPAAVPEVETASEAPPPEAAVPPEAVPLYAPVETVEAVEPPEEQTTVDAAPPVEPEVVATEEVEPAEEPVEGPVEEIIAETPMAVPPLPQSKPRPPVPETPVAETPVAEAPQPAATPEAERGATQTAAAGPQEGPPAAADELVGNAGKVGSGDRAATGAAEGHSGGGAPGAFVDYKAQLVAWLEKHKEYPRRARLRRQEGTALLQFVMDRSGKVLEYRILESSGYKLLDEEVVAMIERASPLPEPPAAMEGERFEYKVPVWFNQR